ncbi:MAG: NPCBM/NEW2 domain-containing protein, partial [Pirellulales bacterium]|nr:NPCBM/NEW2 domain-containing protein [Pirellulales bacterium]
VDANGDTVSYVFEGKIVVQAGIRGFGDSGIRDVQLGAGESVMVGRVRASTHHNSVTGGGGSASGTLRFTHPASQPKFVRRIYEPPKYLDLLDIVAGGDGAGRRRERGIDPATGQQDVIFLRDARCHIRPYMAVAWNPYVDGVFIPKTDAPPPGVQLDSAGHHFDGFPPWVEEGGPPGRTIGSIWSRAEEVTPFNQSRSKRFWVFAVPDADKFMPHGWGLLGLHANAGITFDLAALRKTHKGTRPVRFRSVAGLADAKAVYDGAYGMVDLWVFVDGRLKLKHTQLLPKDDPINVNIELGADDRFLTLVTTDGNNGSKYDWAVWGDPILEVESIGREDNPNKRSTDGINSKSLRRKEDQSTTE